MYSLLVINFRFIFSVLPKYHYVSVLYVNVYLCLKERNRTEKESTEKESQRDYILLIVVLVWAL